MRGGFKLVLVTAVLTALVAGTGPTGPATNAAGSSGTLAAQRAALVAQLQQLAGPRAGALAALVSAEQQLAAVQSQLAAARAQLADVDARLGSLSRRITQDEHDLNATKDALAALVRATYEATARDGFASAILSSGSFNEAMDRVRGAQQVTDSVANLQQAVLGRESSLLGERQALQRNFGDAQAMESQLADQEMRFTALVAQRDQAYAAVNGPARQIAAQIAQIDQQMAGPPAAVSSNGTCGNRFAYGNCTYYVATRRCIPWAGNAYEWWHNAAAMGYAEGHSPVHGAVAVWYPGGGGASSVGHVAYVEAVGPAAGIPAGYFQISEMNWNGWNQVDYRNIPDNASYIVGFIYGKG